MTVRDCREANAALRRSSDDPTTWKPYVSAMFAVPIAPTRRPS